MFKKASCICAGYGDSGALHSYRSGAMWSRRLVQQAAPTTTSAAANSTGSQSTLSEVQGAVDSIKQHIKDTVYEGRHNKAQTAVAATFGGLLLFAMFGAGGFLPA